MVNHDFCISMQVDGWRLAARTLDRFRILLLHSRTRRSRSTRDNIGVHFVTQHRKELPLDFTPRAPPGYDGLSISLGMRPMYREAFYRHPASLLSSVSEALSGSFLGGIGCDVAHLHTYIPTLKVGRVS
jgi:hypothetical protein